MKRFCKSLGKLLNFFSLETFMKKVLSKCQSLPIKMPAKQLLFKTLVTLINPNISKFLFPINLIKWQYIIKVSSYADLEEVLSNSSGVAVRLEEVERLIDAAGSGPNVWTDRFDPYHPAGRTVPVS